MDQPATTPGTTHRASERGRSRVRQRPPLTPAEREARGRAARAKVPRSTHALFEPSDKRPDPVGLLQEQAEGRIPELLPLRYGRMVASPFAFFRGAAAVMASDLASTPRSGFDVQLCGDAHVGNFGGYASPERRLLFDITDFDETLPGPWEWDVKRFAASIAVAGRDNGYSAAESRNVLLAAARGYRTAMRSFANQRNLDVWYATIDLEHRIDQVQAHLDPKGARRLERDVEHARSRDGMQAFRKLTTRTADGQRIVSRPPFIVPIEELLPDEATRQRETGGLLKLVRTYRRTLQSDRRALLEQFRFVQVARKVVGVGSVGAADWVALFLGRDGRDPLLLQIKQAERSVLERHLRPSEYANHGQRVVAGQRLIQAASDIFLGWERATSAVDGRRRDFYVRQLRDWKFAFEIGAMLPKGMALFAETCAWALARAHARSGDRIAIAAYLGTGDAFDRAIADFGPAYADQNERDHQALVDAAKAGRVEARTEP